MNRPETPPPSQPEEVFCNNPKWYELYASTEERLAYNARLEAQRNDERIKALSEIFDDCDKDLKVFNKFLEDIGL